MKRPSFLPGDPPPPYEPIDLTIVDKAMQSAQRESTRWAIISSIPYAAILTVLYLLGAPGIVLVLTSVPYTLLSKTVIDRLIDRSYKRRKAR